MFERGSVRSRVGTRPHHEAHPFEIAVATELPGSVTEPDIAEKIQQYYEDIAIPAESFAQAVVFAMSQPDEVDMNEILFRPTRQML